MLFFIGCSDKNDKDTNSEETDNPATQTEVKITVSLPDGWNPVQGSVLEHQYMKGTASFMIKNKYVLDGKNLDDVIIEAKKSLEKTFDNISFSDTQNLKVDNHDAVGLTYVYSILVGGTSMNMKMYGVYIMINKKCYHISFGDLENSFDALSSNIQQIIEGIKFVY